MVRDMAVQIPKPTSFTVAALTGLSVLGQATVAGAQCDQIPDCALVWADEFNGGQLDPSKWEAMIGDGTLYGVPAGWGNNELQYYQAANATVGGGRLTITAREEQVGGRNYTSARIRTQGRMELTYGRFEMRARMPIGQGMWPAFWMLPTDYVYGGWAASGEIDIVELLGHQPSRIHGTIHYGGPWPANTFTERSWDLPSGTFADDFHTFAIEWEEGEIRWYVDGHRYATLTEWYSTGGPYPAPFDQDFHLLLNLAVGGNWPGPPDASTSFPQQLVVDWVRVYQSRPPANTPPTVSITSPADGAQLVPGSELTVAVEVVDTGGVEWVEVHQGAKSLGRDRSPPWQVKVDDIAGGCYTLTAVAQDEGGLVGTSDPVELVVGSGCGQAPYGMTPAALPGTVEAEDYDLGGPGIAYQDAQPANRGGAYRPDEGVDVISASSASNGFAVSWIEAGEWLAYTVEVAESGTYDLDLRIASESGGSLSVEVDGVDVTGALAFGPTGGSRVWRSVPARNVHLQEGVQTLRILMTDGDFAFDRLQVDQGRPNTPPAVTITSPTDGVQLAPGTDLTVVVEVLDTDAVEWVEIHQGAKSLGRDRSPPWRVTVANIAGGCYTLNAVAQDEGGLVGTSDPVDVTVGSECGQAPYGMTPAALPGSVEAEDYDLGGPGIAYWDTDAVNSGGAYRPDEGVDVLSSPMADNGFAVDSIAAGEWLAYTVEVAATDTYEVDLRVASKNGGSLSVEVDGVDVTGPMIFGPTGGSGSWSTVTAGAFELEAGVQTLRLLMLDGSFAVDGFAVLEPPPASPCPALGLGPGDRFQLEVSWATRRGSTGCGTGAEITADTGSFWFFNARNAEVIVKILNACSAHSFANFWVFSAALTNAEYRLTVTDTQTGQIYQVRNPQGTRAPAVLSTNTVFRECGGGAGDGLPTSQVVDTSTLPAPPPATIVETVDPSLAVPCVPGPTSVCLNRGRFTVTADWEDKRGNTGSATFAHLGDDSAYGTFFTATNVELFLKVLDACGEPYHRFWPFLTGLTNLKVRLTIIDTETGKEYRVESAAGEIFPVVLDTASFFDDC